MKMLIALVLLAAPKMVPAQNADLLNHAAPEVSFKLADGTTTKLSDLKGKPVVLSFWASWCGPCRKELPALAALAAKRTDVYFLAVNVDRDRKPAERFLKELKLPLPIAYDPDASVVSQFEVVVMPTTFMVDKNGTVKFKKTGFAADKGLVELIAALDAK